MVNDYKLSKNRRIFVTVGYSLMFLGIVLFMLAMTSQTFLKATTKHLIFDIFELNMGVLAGCYKTTLTSSICLQELGYLVRSTFIQPPPKGMPVKISSPQSRKIKAFGIIAACITVFSSIFFFFDLRRSDTYGHILAGICLISTIMLFSIASELKSFLKGEFSVASKYILELGPSNTMMWSGVILHFFGNTLCLMPAMAYLLKFLQRK